MIGPIKIKSGKLNGRAAMPTLAYDKEKGAEIGYQEEEKALYIGTPSGNVKVCSAEDAVKIAELTAENKELTAQMSELSAKIDEITTRLDELTPSE